MTLRENFDKISCKDCDMPYCDSGCTILSDCELDRLEQIAEDFAIGFAMHISTHCYCELGNDSRSYKELLQIYKKEKGL